MKGFSFYEKLLWILSILFVLKENQITKLLQLCTNFILYFRKNIVTQFILYFYFSQLIFGRVSLMRIISQDKQDENSHWLSGVTWLLYCNSRLTMLVTPSVLRRTVNSWQLCTHCQPLTAGRIGGVLYTRGYYYCSLLQSLFNYGIFNSYNNILFSTKHRRFGKTATYLDQLTIKKVRQFTLVLHDWSTDICFKIDKP